MEKKRSCSRNMFVCWGNRGERGATLNHFQSVYKELLVIHVDDKFTRSRICQAICVFIKNAMLCHVRIFLYIKVLTMPNTLGCQR